MKYRIRHYGKLIAKPSTRIVETIELVPELWRLRFALAPRAKRHRFKSLFPSLEEVYRGILDGTAYTLDEMQATSYWKYLSQYHKSWSEPNPTPRAIRQMEDKFTDALALFWDVAEEGFSHPLSMVWSKGSRYIYKGARRLVVAHVLGYDTVRVRTAFERETHV